MKGVEYEKHDVISAHEEDSNESGDTGSGDFNHGVNMYLQRAVWLCG